MLHQAAHSTACGSAALGRPASRRCRRRVARGRSARVAGVRQRLARLRHPAARLAARRRLERAPDARRTSRCGTGSARRSGSPSAWSSGSGGVPSMVISRLLAGHVPVDARHRVDQRPGVGMARIGEHLLRSAPPRRPRRAYITTTRWQTLAMTPRSWLIRMIAAPKSRVQLARCRSRICAWMVTSSAVVGSSAISSAGSLAEAHREHDALAHAAGELMRVAVDRALRRGDAHAAEQSDRARAVACASSSGRAPPWSRPSGARCAAPD